MHSAASMRSIVRCSLIVLLASAAACSNYELLDKLENPGGKEVFTDRLYIFVTSQMTAGDMFALTASGCSGTGIGKADCVCQALAARNGRRRSASSRFLAWLSDTGFPMNCRFGNAMGLGCTPTGNQIWYNTNNEVVFTGIEPTSSGLMGNTPSAPDMPFAPKYTESGFVVPLMNDNVWTGTNPGGGAAGNTCNEWASNQAGDLGRTGQSDITGSAWTNSSDLGCDLFKRIYCVAVP